MTLAALLLFGTIFAPPVASGQAAPQSTPTATQDQAPASAGQNPPASSPTQPPASQSQSPSHSTTSKPAHHKRKVLPPCDSAPAPNPAIAGSNPAPDASTTGSASNTKPSRPCTPSKVVVRHGGTSEPSIQLAGGPADQTAQKRDVVNQILGSANANLKKIAGQQLTANQQDMVNQIRQFMDQSKAAMDVEDLERARTLAWKAEVLSEELLKPAK